MDYFVNYVISLNYISFFSVFMFIFLTSVYLMKKVIMNIFDPLLILLIFVSFSITFIINMYIDNMISINSSLFLIFSIFLFWLGYYLLHNLYLERHKIVLNLMVKKNGNKHLLLITCILWLILMFSSLFLYIFKGIPLFSEDPSNAKVTLYENGFGIVKYFHMTLPTIIVLQIGFHLLGRKESFLLKRKVDFFIIIILITTFLIPVLSGSKSSLLFILGLFSIILFIRKDNDTKLYRRLYSIGLKFLLVAILYMTLIIVLTPVSSENPLFNLILRLLASGDTYYFYYGYQLEDNKVYSEKFIDDFFEYLISPLLGMIGLIKHDYPLGSYLMYYSTNYPLGSFGPNALLPVLADIYFKKYFALFFMFFMGLFLAFLRIYSIFILFKFKNIGTFIYFFLWSNSLVLFLDINLFISQIYVFFIIILPVLIFIEIILTSGVKNAIYNNRNLQ